MSAESRIALVQENGRSFFRLDGRPFHLLAVSIRADRWWLAWERRGIPPAGRWERLRDLVRRARALGFNTISLPLLWRWVEPTRARYDLTWLERYAALAKENGLKINLLWYGQNYTGENYAGGAVDSSGQHLVPDYIYHGASFQKVLDDGGRFVSSRPDRELYSLCPGDTGLLAREGEAFARVYGVMKDLNADEPLFVCLQVENDPSLSGTDRCYCPRCNEDWGRCKAGEAAAFVAGQFARVIRGLTQKVDGGGPAMTILCNARHGEDDVGVYLREAPSLAGLGLGIFDYSLADCLNRRGGLLRPGWPGFIAENGVAFHPLANLYQSLGWLGLAGFGVYQLVDDPFFYPDLIVNEGLLTAGLSPRLIAADLAANLRAVAAALDRCAAGVTAGWSFGPDRAGEVLRVDLGAARCTILPEKDGHGMILLNSAGELIAAGQHFQLEMAHAADAPGVITLAGEVAVGMTGDTDEWILSLSVKGPSAAAVGIAI